VFRDINRVPFIFNGVLGLFDVVSFFVVVIRLVLAPLSLLKLDAFHLFELIFIISSVYTVFICHALGIH
jgi:hypothetical protein